MSPGLVGFGAGGPGEKGSSVNGVSLRPGTMWAAEAGAEFAFVVEPGHESVFAVFTPDDMKAHFQGRQREARPCSMPRGAEMLQRDPAFVRRFFEWGKRLVTTAERRPELFNDCRETRVAAQVELLEALLSALGATTDVKPPRRDDTRKAQSRIVKDAELYAMARMGDRLYVTDLCEASAVSERSLEYAFKEIMGMSPVAHPTRVRLHRVRHALLAATPGSTTVSVGGAQRGLLAFRGVLPRLPLLFWRAAVRDPSKGGDRPAFVSHDQPIEAGTYRSRSGDVVLSPFANGVSSGPAGLLRALFVLGATPSDVASAIRKRRKVAA